MTKLISITPEAEKLISYIARVSNPTNQNNEKTSSKLLKYLIEHNHWSPFEHASMTIEIITSRAIAAQILRHRSFKFQEFSQRYAKAQRMMVYKARRQDNKNRQNSIDDLDEGTQGFFELAQQEIWCLAKAMYDQALELGIAKESARFLLPLNTETTLYMTGDIRSWIHYIELRSANGTQQEHMDIALACRDIFNEQLPDVAKVLGWIQNDSTISVSSSS